ncbi:MAG: glycoside hydrolase family 43 protein [Sedimentisphaerales bacterium]|nr:glycoside hydrolase family 43 protein [Sedimentisphaerales bacterium]
MSLKILISLILATGVLGNAGTSEKNETKTKENYLFSSFRGNGEDGLHLAYSHDGLEWIALNNDTSFLKPEVGTKLMRDPCICRGPDGTFHMVWTSGWWDKGIGIAHSKDLIKWSEQKWLGVMEHEPTAANCWAPEIFYDKESKKYIIYWSTTIPGRFPDTENTGDSGNNRKLNHRIYYITTEDFENYSKVALLYDDGFNVIDATIVKDKDRYVMFIKDETRLPIAKKNIRIAFSDKLEGPYSHASEPISPDWVEGPTVLKIADTWYLYYDGYRHHRYEGIRSKDLKNWETITDKLVFPKDTRHGTAFRAPDDILETLLKLN